MRENVNNTIPMVNYYGVPLPVCPATTQELRDGGSTPIEYNPNYIEDLEKYNVRQKCVLIMKGNHIKIIGPTASGKDEIARQLAAKSNHPIATFNFNNTSDASGWLSQLEFVNEDGVTVTGQSDGHLKRVAQGLTIYRKLESLTEDGQPLSEEEVKDIIAEMESHRWIVKETSTQGVYQITIPFIIVFSDADRASNDQLETLRQAIELGKEMLTNPITGEMFPVCPGTRFVFTANSGVDGDDGRGMVVKQNDASITNRMSAIHIGHPSEEVEKVIYQAAFPEVDPQYIEMVVKCTRALRVVVRQEYLQMDVSIRNGSAWLIHALEMKEFYGCDMTKALKESFCSISNHFMGEQYRQMFESAVNVFLVKPSDSNDQKKPSEQNSHLPPFDRG